jgi:hypothetical protein
MTKEIYNKQQGTSFFGILFWLIVGYFVYSYIVDGDFKDMSAHAEDLRETLENFADQKGVAQKAYKDAMDAKNTAVTVGLKFKDEKTQIFVDKWKDAADDVSELRERLNDIDTKAELFFVHIDDELDKINDRSLRNKMDEAVETKAKSFAKSLKKADQAIAVLENSISKGDDIITAIKISGALGSVSDQVAELDDLAKSADMKFSEIDALVAEGMNVLTIELN